MDKIKINNQIILMRKHVKQAKIHTINKLVKQVKLLQNRKGNDAQIQKAKRKAERYLKEVDVLKKMKPDLVSKQALSKAKNWKVILAQKNSTMEERSLALLANYEPVQKEVQKFYLSNSNLVPKITDLIEQWELKSKFTKQTDSQECEKFFFLNTGSSKDQKVLEKVMSYKKGQKIGSPSKESPLLNLKKAEDLSQTSEEQTMEENEKMHESFEKGCELDSVENNSQEHGVSDNEKSSENSDLESNESNSINNSENGEISNDIEKNEVYNNKNEPSEVNHLDKKARGPVFKCKKIKKKLAWHSRPNDNHLKTITVLNLAELDGIDEIPVESRTENEDLEDRVSDVESSALSSDPFFLKPGESPPVPDKKTIIPPEKKYPAFTREDGTRMNRYERRHGQPKHRPSDPETKSHHQKHSYRGNFQTEHKEKPNFKAGNKKDFISEDTRGFRKQSNFDSNFKMHSSQEKPSQPPSKRKENAFQVGKRPLQKETNILDDKPLHPSWEAKKKQNQLSQTPFQGKRVVFGD